MSILIGLDVSTKPGFAVFEDGKLIRYGTIWAEKTVEDFGPYPMNYVLLAEWVSSLVLAKVIGPELEKCDPYHITVVIEETTGSNQNYTQKRLEYIHFCLVRDLHAQGLVPKYIRDGVWKNLVGARQNAEEKKLQAKISRQKKKKKKDFIKANPGVEKIPSFRAKLDLDGSGKAKVVAKLDQADYSIRAFKEHFGIQLNLEDEDAAEAALLVLAFLKNAPICDGTIDGGIPVKSGESDQGVSTGNQESSHDPVA